MSSVAQGVDGYWLDGDEERGNELIITRRNGAEFLEFAEEPFDQVALAMKSKVGLAFCHAIGLGRSDRGIMFSLSLSSARILNIYSKEPVLHHRRRR